MKIVYMTTLATVLLSGTTFADTALNSNDLKQMHETYAANQARFAHDFVGSSAFRPRFCREDLRGIYARIEHYRKSSQ